MEEGGSKVVHGDGDEDEGTGDGDEDEGTRDGMALARYV